MMEKNKKFVQFAKFAAKSFAVKLLAVMLVVFSGCPGKGDKPLSSDLVTNPKSAQQSEKIGPVLQFDKTEYDFGNILQGEVVSYTFHFTNAGDAPLIITGVDKSCGCTASEFPRQPIAPGQTGSIKITYDSKGHHGFQSKGLVVNANTNPAHTSLRVKAMVKTPNDL